MEKLSFSNVAGRNVTKKDESLYNESLFAVILGTPLLRNSSSKQRHR